MITPMLIELIIVTLLLVATVLYALYLFFLAPQEDANESANESGK